MKQDRGFLDFLKFLQNYKVSYRFDGSELNLIFKSDLSNRQVIMNRMDFNKEKWGNNIRFLKENFGFEEE